MGKLSLTLIVVGTAACGSDNKNNIDAHIVVPDAKPIDAAKVFMDAPPPTYDFSCFGKPAPTTATNPVTISGTTGELSQNGLAPTDGVAVSFFKAGNATAVANTTSAGGGLFASENVTTGGVPLDAYISASIAASRTTYLYPPNLLTANLASVPVPLISDQLFSLLHAGAMVQQDDVNNGVILAIISDCALTPLNGATLSAKQGGVEKGTQFDLSTLSAMAAGTFVVFNIPDGATELTAKYNNMTFPVKTVLAHKKAGDTGPGTITATAVVPGPF